jgi:hypothetical protein
LLKNRQQLPQAQFTDADYFIYCLEAVPTIETDKVTEAQKNLEQLTMQYGISSIYKTCDRLKGKILHFSNAKVLDLEAEEAQYFLDITGAKGVSGYGNEFNGISSSNLDKAFFNLFKEDENMLDVVEELHQKHYNVCKILDFRLYY